MIKVVTTLGFVCLVCTVEILGMVIVQQQKQSVSTGTQKNPGDMVFPWHSMSNQFNTAVSAAPSQSTNVVNAIAPQPPAASRSGVLTPQSRDRLDVSSSQQQVVAPQSLPMGPTPASLDARSAVQAQPSIDQVPGPLVNPDSQPSQQIPANGQSPLPQIIGLDGSPRSVDPGIMPPPPPQTVPVAQTLNPAPAGTPDTDAIFFPQIISIPDSNANAVLPQTSATSNGLPAPPPPPVPSGTQTSPQNLNEISSVSLPRSNAQMQLPRDNQRQGLDGNALAVSTDSSLLPNLPVAPVSNGSPQTSNTAGSVSNASPNMVANEWNFPTTASPSPLNV